MPATAPLTDVDFDAIVRYASLMKSIPEYEARELVLEKKKEAAQTVPTLKAFIPKPAVATGCAAIVVPGGCHIEFNKNELDSVCVWLQEMGVAAFLVQHRLGAMSTGAPSYPACLMDVERAVRVVKMHAAQYGVDPKRVGVVGFGSGAHLAALVAVNPNLPNHKPPHSEYRDDADALSASVAFAILGYPVLTMKGDGAEGHTRLNLLGPTGSRSEALLQRLSAEEHVNTFTPPTFLFTLANDHVVNNAANAFAFASKLEAAGMRYEIHSESVGMHGCGTGKKRDGPEPMHPWVACCERWLHREGIATRITHAKPIVDRCVGRVRIQLPRSVKRVVAQCLFRIERLLDLPRDDDRDFGISLPCRTDERERMQLTRERYQPFERGMVERPRKSAEAWHTDVHGLDKVDLYRSSELFKNHVLSSEQIITFVRDGYIVLRGVIPKEFIHAALETVTPNTFDESKASPYLNAFASKRAGAKLSQLVWGTPVGAYALSLLGEMKDEPFTTWSSDWGVIQHAANPPDTGSDLYKLCRAEGRHGPQEAFWLDNLDGWHIDGVQRGRLTMFSLLCGIALTPQPYPGSGCLCVWPGTHHAIGKKVKEHLYEGPYLDAARHKRRSKLRALEREFVQMMRPNVEGASGAVACTLEQGDVVFAHSKLAHRAGPNLSDCMRHQLYVRFSNHPHRIAVKEEVDDIWHAFNGPGVKDAVKQFQDHSLRPVNDWTKTLAG